MMEKEFSEDGLTVFQTALNPIKIYQDNYYTKSEVNHEKRINRLKEVQ